MTDITVRSHTLVLKPANGCKLLRCTRCGRFGTLASFLGDRCPGPTTTAADYWWPPEADQFVDSAFVERVAGEPCTAAKAIAKNGAPAEAGAPSTITNPPCTTSEDRTPEQ